MRELLLPRRTGAKGLFEQRSTKRRFDPNIQRKRYWLPSENRYVRLTLSAKGIKTVDVIGVEAAVARIRARGGKV